METSSIQTTWKLCEVALANIFRIVMHQLEGRPERYVSISCMNDDGSLTPLEALLAVTQHFYSHLTASGTTL
jgi:hypothetical protein